MTVEPQLSNVHYLKHGNMGWYKGLVITNLNANHLLQILYYRIIPLKPK